MADVRWESARPVLGSSDLERSKAFWCGLLGFGVAVEREGYDLLRAGEAEVALERVARPVPTEILLHVHGIDRVFERCAAAGVVAQALHTHDSARRDFVALDPDGHRVRIADPVRHGARVAWVDLTVEDATTSRDFWARVVGFDGAEPVEMGGYADFTLTRDNRPVAGVCHRRGVNANLPPVWLVYFSVDDLPAALAEVQTHGGRVLERRGPMAVVADPSGAVAALYQA